MFRSLSLKAPPSPAQAFVANAVNDACSQRMDAETLCAAWRHGDDAAAQAAAFKQTVAYDAVDAVGKACVYHALYQLGTAGHATGGNRANKRWWRGLDAQFAEGKQAWRQIEQALQQAAQVPSLRASLTASRDKLREAQQELVTLRASVDGLLVHVRGQAALQQELHVLMRSLASAQEHNRALQAELHYAHAHKQQIGLLSGTSLEASLQRPSAPRAKPSVARLSVPPSLEGLLQIVGTLEGPPSYPTTPETEVDVALAG